MIHVWGLLGLGEVGGGWLKLDEAGRGKAGLKRCGMLAGLGGE
jgi:hypothetical protein